MRYRLRTLLIVLAIGPPVLAVVWGWINQPRGEGIMRFFAGGDIRIEGKPDR